METKDISKYIDSMIDAMAGTVTNLGDVATIYAHMVQAAQRLERELMTAGDLELQEVKPVITTEVADAALKSNITPPMARVLKMSKRDDKHKWRYGKPPVYINFPVSMFKQLDGDCLDVRQFKEMVDNIINYGIADWYRRECSAWHDPNEYNAAIFSQVQYEMGISAGVTDQQRKRYFIENIAPLVPIVGRTAGKAFCGIDKDMIFYFRDNDVSDYECVQLLVYCAIRSILGSAWVDITPSVKRIAWGFILSRMAGTVKRIPLDELPPFIQYYASKRHRAKLRKSLINKWHVQIDGQSRGPGGAFYMLYQDIPIAEAIQQAKQAWAIRREIAARKAQANDPGVAIPLPYLSGSGCST